MGAFKTVTDSMMTWFDGNGTINEVTHGDINQVDLTQHTHFPLAHVIYLNTVYAESFTTYNYQILLLDTYHDTVDDRLEVLDAMDGVATQFVKALNGGSLFESQIRAAVTPTGEIMYDQLQNRLYGISLTVSIITPTGIDNCG